jgi:hypothetical protein
MSLVLDPRVQSIAEAEGILPSELQEMVVRAAINRQYEGFNRRFQHWLLKIEDNHVLGMRHLEMMRLGFDRGCGVEEEECELCDGQGCKDCGWIGQIERYRLPKI